MKRLIVGFVVLMVVGVTPVLAQGDAPPPHVDEQDYYQIFLKDAIEKVKKVEYSQDSIPVKFKLTEDGSTIELYDYKGSGTLRIVYTDAAGMEQEMFKPICKIHSLQVL